MRKIFKYIDKPLLLITIALFIFGLIMVFSASNVTAYMSHAASPYKYFLKQGAFLLVGFIISLFLIRFNTRSYNYFSYPIMIICIVALVLVLIPGIGSVNNQAKSWFEIGPISIQPSEFIKVAVIVFLACYYDINKKKLNKWTVSLFPIAICLMVAGLIFIQPDLGTTIIFCCIVGAIFLSVPISKEIKFKTSFISLGLLFFVIVVILGSGKGVLLERQLERFNFTNPCSRILDDGNQVCNCYIAINNGGLTGVGLGNSTQKYLYLPEPYTDFIFAIIVEELGVIAGVILILAYIFILYRILLIGRKCPNNRGATICYGVAIYIFLHIAINLMGIMGIMPMTGVPLPFISYGGSFTTSLIIALTLVQRISFENAVMSQKK